MANVFRVIAYDIPEDRRRTKIAKILEGYGTRVNDSVFETLLEDAQYRRLRRKMDRYIVPEDDAIRFYTLCGADVQKIEVIGGIAPRVTEPDFIVF